MNRRVTQPLPDNNPFTLAFIEKAVQVRLNWLIKIDGETSDFMQAYRLLVEVHQAQSIEQIAKALEKLTAERTN